MLLKKQTVWLLTMLSLVIVLSVYYVTTPTETENNMANTVQTEEGQATENGKDPAVAEDTDKVQTEEIVPTAGDETFESMRMEVQDERNRLIEELTAMVSNTELPAEERDEASQKIQQLREVNVAEELLETLIVGIEKNQSALVRMDGNDVKVTVKAPELSKSAVVDIVRLVSDEVPTAQNVVVELQPTK